MEIKQCTHDLVMSLGSDNTRPEYEIANFMSQLD